MEADEHPGEGWDDGRPSTRRQLRMFIAGLLFALGLFTSVFLAIRLMQVVGLAHHQAEQMESDLEIWMAVRTGLASLRLQDFAVCGVVLGPMLLAGRAMLTVFTMLSVLAFAFTRALWLEVEAIQSSTLGMSDPNSWASVILLGLLASFTIGSLVALLFSREDKAQ